MKSSFNPKKKKKDPKVFKYSKDNYSSTSPAVDSRLSNLTHLHKSFVLKLLRPSSHQIVCGLLFLKNKKDPKLLLSSNTRVRGHGFQIVCSRLSFAHIFVNGSF